MSSVVLSCVEIKSYCESIGPGRGRPPRPDLCSRCDGRRVWFDGWRTVFAVVLADGTAHRFDEGLPLQRVVCPSCECSWTVRPAFLYPHRSFEPDVDEAAAFAYLTEPTATYAAVATRFTCSARSVWRWVGWVAALVAPAVLVAAAVRHAGETASANAIPRAVPAVDRKARSARRRRQLLAALQVLAALAALMRAQRFPPTDPSPLRAWLQGRFLAFRQIAFVTRSGLSPPTPDLPQGPAG